ncbi:pantetheine-phosphate adenylyltransferase [Desulforhopalus singaporensis]|uniref:Phosphopantetheine adenylyltransferase n=1 Tax=Desulforhopalus singaporensis TaxID=91360 RepID=A0A1H0MNY1_9BACT|nr:pantetheine-phosphate adenylyltransferase [Desulforhopalus singaporensis]SDO82132.1 Phosphopantetheine adenylyltransferase [Desulforhopalus singaporensis]
MGTDNKQESTLAIYPGTFDPITMGHVDIINRALNLFDRVIVAVAVNISKDPVFGLDERIQMIKETFVDNPKVQVDSVSGLSVDYAYRQNAKAIVRGIRAVSDFDYEFQLALMNRKLQREVESVFLMPGFRWIYISSTIIKDAARNGGDVSDLVPPHVNRALLERFR